MKDTYKRVHGKWDLWHSQRSLLIHRWWMYTNTQKNIAPHDSFTSLSHSTIFTLYSHIFTLFQFTNTFVSVETYHYYLRALLYVSFIWRSLHFFNKSYLFLFLCMCYYYYYYHSSSICHEWLNYAFPNV